MNKLILLLLFMVAITATVLLYVFWLQQTIISSSLLQSDSKTQQQQVKQQQQQQTLVLTIKDTGTIRIVLRPDLSPESVHYIKQLVRVVLDDDDDDNNNNCQHCNLYRAEKPGILQGILKSTSNNNNNNSIIPKGPCPAGFETVPNDCPKWDKECGCHGPIMKRGMVAWAAGATGPDFFIDTYPREAKWWGTQHTNFGQIQDDESFRVIDSIYELPTRKQGGLTMLQTPLQFDVSLE